MNKSKNRAIIGSSSQSSSFSLVGLLFVLFTAVVGHHIHGSVFWTIIDCFLAPFVWIKWLICHEVNITLIKSAFSFFFQ